MLLCRLYRNMLTEDSRAQSEAERREVAAARLSFSRLLPHFWRLLEGYDASLTNR